MRITDAYWTDAVNVLVIACRCGEPIYHRADRWLVKCSGCGARERLAVLRDAYVVRWYVLRLGPWVGKTPNRGFAASFARRHPGTTVESRGQRWTWLLGRWVEM